MEASYITSKRVTAYLAAGVEPESGAAITDWHGNPIGRYYVNSSWYTGRQWATKMYAISAVIGKRWYHGRTQGAGMCVSLKASKHQPWDVAA